jgi:hypothetical protein
LLRFAPFLGSGFFGTLELAAEAGVFQPQICPLRCAMTKVVSSYGMPA